MSSEVEPILHQCSNCSVMLDVSEQEPFALINCPSCDVAMRVRKQFNNFELVEVIASGGMGTVYKARDVNLNRIVALKLLRKEFSADQEYIEKLETEAKITASVNHPHVVKVFSFGSDWGQYYIAMELVDKGSLDDLMNLQGRIAEVQVLEIGVQAAMGLRAAFQAGLVHRDVKPGNILFADAHTAKIVDFGLAIPMEQAQEEIGGDIWGTPYYVAPEKLNHEPEDFRSDIYSLGGTLFHALAGRPPFEAENASLVALKHLKNQAVSLQAFAPDISSPTSYVINRTLAKNPDERYQSYDELIEHLEYARSQLLENSGKRQEKVRVVVEGAEQQEAFGYINIAIIGFVLVIGLLFFLFRDTILNRRLSVQELEERRSAQGAGAVEQALIDARKNLIAGKTDAALAALKEIANRPNLQQPAKNWATLTLGIGQYLGNHASDAHGTFDRLRNDGMYSFAERDSKLTSFFTTVGRAITEDKPIDPNLGKQYATPAFEPLAILAFALKDWQMGRFEDAASLFQDFVSSEPTGSWSWIADFKAMAKPYQEDYAVFSELPGKIKNAKGAADQAALIPQIDAIKAKLHMPGKLPEQIETYRRIFKFSAGFSSGRSRIAGWTSKDIGEIGLPGDVDFVKGAYRVDAGGTDIWGSEDSFFYVCRQMTGDGAVIGRVFSLSADDRGAKVGVMMRETLNSKSRHVSTVAYNGGNARCLLRSTTEGVSSEPGKPLSCKRPVWLKLVRSGDNFSSFASKDGVTWEALKEATIPMNSVIYVGMAFTAHNKNSTVKAALDNVTVTTGGDTH